MRRALVIGGSLGGLIAAHLLRSTGWDAVVFERNEEELASRRIVRGRRGPPGPPEALCFVPERARLPLCQRELVLKNNVPQFSALLHNVQPDVNHMWDADDLFAKCALRAS